VSNPLEFGRWLDNPVGAVMSLSLLAVAVCTCCWSLRRYCENQRFIRDETEAFDQRTTAHVEVGGTFVSDV
jgi:hypothetical protein